LKSKELEYYKIRPTRILQLQIDFLTRFLIIFHSILTFSGQLLTLF